jgi:hypothetical protein
MDEASGSDTESRSCQSKTRTPGAIARGADPEPPDANGGQGVRPTHRLAPARPRVGQSMIMIISSTGGASQAARSASTCGL